jgi:protein-disulfide isomerase
VLPLPFFGEASQYAAKVSLAAFKQGKYNELHAKLMEAKLPLKKEAIQEIAKSLKLNMNKLAVDLKDKKIADELASNIKLAENIGLMGTPAIIIANDKEGAEFKSFYTPGVVDYDALDSLVKQASGQKADSVQKNDKKEEKK